MKAILECEIKGGLGKMTATIDVVDAGSFVDVLRGGMSRCVYTAFIDRIDETDSVIYGTLYRTSYALKEVDPIWFNECLLDFIDEIGKEMFELLKDGIPYEDGTFTCFPQMEEDEKNE